MYLEASAKMVIGDSKKGLTFVNFNKIVINESVNTIGSKATVTIPRNYAKLNGKSVLDLIKTGDRVTISMGYNGKLIQEFSGYIREIEANTPLVLHVDDELYPLKRTSFKKAWQSVTLKEMLAYIAPGYKIICPSVNLGAQQIANVSAFRVLMDIQNKFGFSTIVKNKTITCQFPYELKGSGNVVTYKFYTQNVKKNDLKYRRAEDSKIRVRVSSKQRNGKTIKIEVGAKEGEGSLYETQLPTLTQTELKTFAENWYKKLAFDGYTGSVTGFGYPITHAGDTLKIVDPLEPDREGSYLIEEVTITYSLNEGFERENKLSYKV